jgi:hypothetical protein
MIYQPLIFDVTRGRKGHSARSARCFTHSTFIIPSHGTRGYLIYALDMTPQARMMLSV